MRVFDSTLWFNLLLVCVYFE